MPGVGIRAVFRPVEYTLLLEARAEIFGGMLTYDGQYQDGTPLRTSTIDVLVEQRGVIGYDFHSGRLRITPYMGVGYRYWFDRIQDEGGYRREIHHLMMPMGLELAWDVKRTLVAGVRGEYDLFLQGWVDSHLSDVHPEWGDARNRQRFGSGHGARGAAFVTWACRPGAFLAGEAFVRYWHVADSERTIVSGPDDSRTSQVEEQYYVWEPENRAVMLGLTIGVAF